MRVKEMAKAVKELAYDFRRCSQRDLLREKRAARHARAALNACSKQMSGFPLIFRT
eukprot:IDg19837t1